MQLLDSAGQVNTLQFSTECINTLVMNLPEMALSAIQVKYNDPSLRVTYPLDTFDLMFGATRDARVLTLKTSEGFSVSFALTEAQCHAISDAASSPIAWPKQH